MIARLGVCLVGGLVIALLFLPSLIGDWEGGGGLDWSIDGYGPVRLGGCPEGPVVPVISRISY